MRANKAKCKSYDENGTLKEEYEYDDSGLHVVSKISYDEQGNVESRTEYEETDITDEISRKYDADGNLISEIQYDYFGKVVDE